MQISELTSQQYYGGLNRRFDKRIALIAKTRLQYDPILVGWFNPSHRNGWRMSNSYLIHAHNRAFYQVLDSLLR